MAKVLKSRGWITEVYPESAADNWIDKMTEIGCQAVISPLHDKDINADGTIKKAHYHVLLLWDGPTTEGNPKRIVNMIHGVGCFPCMSVRGTIRYHIHLDNPEKYQYAKEDIRTIGGVDINKAMMSETEEQMMFAEIQDFLRQTGIDSYSDFLDYCMYHNTEWHHLILTKYRENLFRYIRSIEYDNTRGYRARYWAEQNEPIAAEGFPEVSGEQGEEACDDEP